MKQFGWTVALLVAVGAGWFVRGLVPSGGPPPGMMGPGGMPKPAVQAVEIREQPLDTLDEYIATIEPVQQVSIKSEVSGYINAVHFEEGQFVEAGDLLFTIDRSQYQALVEAREAERARAQAELKRAEQFLQRMKEADRRSVSQSDLEAAESTQLQAVAALKQAEANLNMARIDLEYTEIRSPIAGRIGTALMTKGNYVEAMLGDTLARIVQMDPIRVTFSVTDREYLSVKQQVLGGEIEPPVAWVRLPNGVRLSQTGIKDFDDNVLNENTGSLAVRYLFDNPDGLLIPGGYATILLGSSDRPMGIRIPQKAVMVDQQGSYVMTVSEDGTVGTARVKTGNPVGEDIIIREGLEVGNRIVVEGLQKVQPGSTASVTLLEETGQ